MKDLIKIANRIQKGLQKHFPIYIIKSIEIDPICIYLDAFTQENDSPVFSVKVYAMPDSDVLFISYAIKGNETNVEPLKRINIKKIISRLTALRLTNNNI